MSSRYPGPRPGYLFGKEYLNIQENISFFVAFAMLGFGAD